MLKCSPLLFLLLPLTLLQAQDDQLFGKKESMDSALIGIIYDFKQTQKRQPTGVTPKDYPSIFGEFLAKGWDESVLNRYFRSARPLYTTQIYIPQMGAAAAPKAFGMEKVIKPSVWMVHYKGQVSAPADGTYRFVGYSDDMLAVAVNGKTVLVGGRFHVNPDIWKSSAGKKGPKAANGELTYGDWIPLKKGEPFDLDVAIGEVPGGLFNAFLFYQKQGVNEDSPIMPIFQLAPYATASYPANQAPAFAPATEVWQGHQ